TIALLDPELPHLAKDGDPSPSRRDHREQRDLVDKARDFSRRDLSPPERSRAGNQVAHRLVESNLPVLGLHPTAPAAQHVKKANPRRVDADACDPQLTPLGENRRAHEKGGRGRITRDPHGERLEPSSRGELDPAVAILDPVAERAKESLGVITGSSV